MAEDDNGTRVKAKRKKNNGYDKHKLITRWSIIISVLTFFTAIGISMVSDFFLRGSTIWLSLIVLLAIVTVGTLCDVFAVAITAVDLKPFTSMAAKKVYGAKQAIHIIKNAEKYSNFFADVVGDVAGYIAGVAGTTFVLQIIVMWDTMRLYESVITVLVAGVTSSLIVGSKAVGKNIALNHKTIIVLYLGKAITLFTQFRHVRFKRGKKQGKLRSIT